MSKWIFIFLAIVPALSSANEVVLQCAGYKLELIPDSFFKINGEFVTSQKIKMLGDNQTGMKVDMGLMPSKDGNSYGYQYIHPAGSGKRWLNVQLLQNSADAPKIIGTYDCVKINN